MPPWPGKGGDMSQVDACRCIDTQGAQEVRSRGQCHPARQAPQLWNPGDIARPWPMQHWLGPRTCLRAAAGRRGGLGDDDSLPLQPSPNGLAQDFLIGAEILAEAPASIGPSHIIFYSNVIVPRLEPAMAPPRAPAGSHQTPKWSCSRPAPSLTSCAWSAR
jgi:hypothetical protein